MTDNPGDIMVYVILAGAALFIVAAGVAFLSGEVTRAVNTRRHLRANRRFTSYARQARRRLRVAPSVPPPRSPDTGPPPEAGSSAADPTGWPF